MKSQEISKKSPSPGRQGPLLLGLPNLLARLSPRAHRSQRPATGATEGLWLARVFSRGNGWKNGGKMDGKWEFMRIS